GGGGGTGETIHWYSGSCGGTPVGTGNGLSVTPTVTTTYFGRYEDPAPCSFNSLCASVTVFIETNPPSITGCPANITTNTGPGHTACDQVVTWTPPTATDNCAVSSFTSNHNPGDTFPVGTTTVTYTAIDTASNTATCSFTVTVVDNTPPTITCPANLTDV